MVKKEMYPIQEKVTFEELEKRIKYIETLIKILDRLYFVRYRYMGDSVEEAAKKVGVTKRVGYIWQKRWNRDGYPGLLPRYKGGRPSKLNLEQKAELKQYLVQNEGLTSHQIREYIEEKFDVEYSLKQVRLIIKTLG
ncbi:transposase [Methanohalophilus levihalophilus]|uniref:helix-turn-helix domain-containing protein n=1 Tax=Methanohalophilus levihalophilus TaxID=1431282 RepID=UPI001AEB0D22|nr:helix-turn-helix domain-containing protein [Methanohalophilus levihalophilus]MBP2029800.1 transposase [Methanohalophilus levihalophilus]